jgi:hypothetical protein
MKAAKIVIGSMAAVYTAFALVVFAIMLSAKAYGTADMAVALMPVCLGLMVSHVCFQRAFKKSDGDRQKESEKDPT